MQSKLILDEHGNTLVLSQFFENRDAKIYWDRNHNLGKHGNSSCDGDIETVAISKTHGVLVCTGRCRQNWQGVPLSVTTLAALRSHCTDNYGASRYKADAA